ncbi:transcription regulator [Actinidia rufa]|uniref:Transcription regulator n=1 Tax=Actinidia rufa TaxID=165716 RepID=A0A7J0GJP0_9ERIC|nr:transcription regulator [Actinidia rufa]
MMSLTPDQFRKVGLGAFPSLSPFYTPRSERCRADSIVLDVNSNPQGKDRDVNVQIRLLYPWTMDIFGFLVEIYAIPNLKMNLKFDIKVVFKNLGVDMKDVTPTSVLQEGKLKEILTSPTKMLACLNNRWLDIGCLHLLFDTWMAVKKLAALLWT